MGAVTLSDPPVNKPVRTVFGDRFVRFWTATMSNSYATGGDTVSFLVNPFKVGLDYVDIEDFNVDATHVYRAVFDRTNGKIKVVNLITGVEVANAFDLSAVAFRVMAVGK